MRSNIEKYLRKAEFDDALELTILYDIVWYQVVEGLGEKLFKARRANKRSIQSWISRHTYFLIEKDYQVVAALGCEKLHGTLHLVHLATHPDYRRRGFGEALMHQAEKYALELGVRKLWFDTAPALDTSHRLYEKLGYEKCGHMREQFWGIDIIFYEKML